MGRGSRRWPTVAGGVNESGTGNFSQPVNLFNLPRHCDGLTNHINVVLSFVAKSLLAWQVFAGTLAS